MLGIYAEHRGGGSAFPVQITCIHYVEVISRHTIEAIEDRL
jgi:hypothetical protein